MRERQRETGREKKRGRARARETWQVSTAFADIEIVWGSDELTLKPTHSLHSMKDSACAGL